MWWKRARAGTYQIVVDQIPYQVQKAKLIERIAQLIEEKKLPALDDVRDESTEDIRIVLMPKSRTVEPEILMEQLFRQTELESRVPLNLNVLDKGVCPRVMSLREAWKPSSITAATCSGAAAVIGSRASPTGWRCWTVISPSI